MTVSVRELKNSLSKYLRRAQAGEEIVVTSHGKPVGRLLGPDAGASNAVEDQLARLRAQPWLRRGNGRKLCQGTPVSVPDGTSDEALRWVRGE